MSDTSSGTSVRILAIQALTQVFAHQRKAATALNHACSSLDTRDSALLHDMVLGVLRRFFSLEADVSRFLSQKPDLEARLCLLLGAYQLRHMRIPEHAAVSESVQAIKTFQPKAAGMINAVLRKLVHTPPPDKLKPYQRAELPKWLYSQWRQAWGEATVQTLAHHLQVPPPLCLAVFEERQAWMDAVAQQGISATAGELSPHAVCLPSGTAVTTLPGFEQGHFTVMDQAAQAAVMALHAPERGLILDICAAPGGKTALLAHRFPQADILSIEMNGKRIPRLQANLKRLQQTRVHIIQANGLSLPLPDHSADAILLDAPCSASGILRRHPDAKFLHQKDDTTKLAQQQTAMLNEAWRILKPGGHLVYAVCSIHPQENEEVLQGFSVMQRQRLFPSAEHDGFFWACLRK